MAHKFKRDPEDPHRWLQKVSEATVISFKTAAWASPGMARTYAASMDQTGHAFKTALELELIQRFTIGRDILDIGTGTGRVAVSLARQGYRVVAVDASQAMLDQARSIGRDVPIDLRIGDINSLPVPNACIDTAISLNCAIHFPNWKEYVLEWKRVMRPHGRLIFDVGSMDHIDAVSRVLGKSEEQLLGSESSTSEYYMRLRWHDLLTFCNDHGLRILNLVPVGMLSGTSARWQLNGGMAQGLQWKRMLDVMAKDSRIFSFGKFIEQELVACLSPEATGFIFVVLENAADPEANKRFRVHTEALTKLLSSPPELRELEPFLRTEPTSWRNTLSEHMKYAPNRVFAFMQLTGMPRSWFDSFFLDSLFGAEIAELFRDWRALRATDFAAEHIGQSWYSEVAERFYEGVDMGSVMQYRATEQLIAASSATRLRSLR